MRRFLTLAFIIAASAAFLTLCPPAFGYDEPHDQVELYNGSHHSDNYNCDTCHRATVATNPSGECWVCHNGTMFGTPDPSEGKGPHGVYSTTSDKCDACHTVHNAGGTLLLSSATVTGSCDSCHDGTGGSGVYWTIRARGLSEAASHSIDATNVVPGGSGSDGGDSTMVFGGTGGKLSCNDCHSPHDSNTVQVFTAERRRTSFDHLYQPPNNPALIIKTNRLLRRNPGGSTATATVYGSDWCLACHRGRASGGALHNHPVDSSVTASLPFSYESVPVLASDAPTSAVTTGTIAHTNRGYLMPYPRMGSQVGRSPICQQCHEDSRSVGSLSADGSTGDATPFSVTATDGLNPADIPRFQNFPHETANARFLVESGDDLCLNCHPPAVLP